MGQGVAITTEQAEIGDLGLTVIGPGDEVVNIAPARRAGTTRPGAVPVTGRAPPEILERTGSPLAGGAGFVGSPRGHQGIESDEKGLSGQRGELELAPHHPVGPAAYLEASPPQLLLELQAHPRRVDPVAPVVDGAFGLLEASSDDLQQNIFGQEYRPGSVAAARKSSPASSVEIWRCFQAATVAGWRRVAWVSSGSSWPGARRCGRSVR